MSIYILFILLGLGAGSVYALLGLGLVLKYRSTGVVDFAQGAVAMFGAYVFLGLRNRGVLELPWVWLPHEITLSDTGLSTIPALLITLVYGCVFGLVIFALVYRPLLHAAPLTKVCASVGVMLALTAIAVINFGTTSQAAPSILPTNSFRFSDIAVPVDRFYLAGIVLVVAGGLTILYRYTRFGLATRAGAENEVGASLVGISPTRIAAQNWLLATLLATISGVLITPISSLDPNSYTLFIVPALGAALIGRFQSFWVTALAGLGLGIVQSELIKLQTVWTWLPQQGLADGVPFLVILVVMTLSAERIGARGESGFWRNPSLGRPTRPVLTSLLTFAAGVILLCILQGSLRAAFMASIVSACMCLSLVILTGYVGQVSLAQMSFAGIGAFALSHITEQLGVPFPLSMILAALAVVPVGILIGLPALRVRGVNLAVVTLAAAAAMDALLFGPSFFSGGLGGRSVKSPNLFGLDLGIAKGDAYPRVIFGVFLLVVVVFVGYCVARLRTSSTGRMLVAVRSNERAAASVGIRVAPVKLYAFALSSFVAGLGGALLAYQQGTVSSASFAVLTSLSLLAIAYVAGIGRIAGAVIAGLLFAGNGLMVSVIDKVVTVGQYQTLVAGIALAFTAIKNPDGVASEIVGDKGLALRFVHARDRIFKPRRKPAPWQAGPPSGGANAESSSPEPVNPASPKPVAH